MRSRPASGSAAWPTRGAATSSRRTQPGDVVVAHIPDKGWRMRVSYVEDVCRDGDGKPGAVVVTSAAGVTRVR
jgi:hypothetical protein